MGEKIVIIDTDAGMDDATAIFMALAAHKDPKRNFRIAGITCVHGNTLVDNVCMNVTRILMAADASEIPIFRGCDTPMVVPYKRALHFGSDGFGDVLPSEEPKIQEENGVLAMIRIVKEFPGQVTILALGPLTNLAMAVRLEPNFKDLVKEIYLMGGNSEGVGNTTICAEFNFRVDPEAALVTLASFPCPIVIVPLEINRRQNNMEFRLNELAKIRSPMMDLMNLIEAEQLKRITRWTPYDALAAAVLIDPKVITESKNLHTTVELCGNHTRGQMVLDREHLLQQERNATIVYEVDYPLYLRMIKWGFDGVSYEEI